MQEQYRPIQFGFPSVIVCRYSIVDLSLCWTMRMRRYIRLLTNGINCRGGFRHVPYVLQNMCPTKRGPHMMTRINCCNMPTCWKIIEVISKKRILVCVAPPPTHSVHCPALPSWQMRSGEWGSVVTSPSGVWAELRDGNILAYSEGHIKLLFAPMLMCRVRRTVYVFHVI